MAYVVHMSHGQNASSQPRNPLSYISPVNTPLVRSFDHGSCGVIVSPGGLYDASEMSAGAMQMCMPQARIPEPATVRHPSN